MALTSKATHMQMTHYLPEDIPEEVDLKYVCGSCMYLAAALNRTTGWPISVSLSDDTPQAYIEHAWVADAPSKLMFDINGVYPDWQNSFDHPDNVIVTGLTERQLLELTRKTSGHVIPQDDWDGHVDEALEVAERYFSAQVKEATAYKLAQAPAASRRRSVDTDIEPGL